MVKQENSPMGNELHSKYIRRREATAAAASPWRPLRFPWSRPRVPLAPAAVCSPSCSCGEVRGRERRVLCRFPGTRFVSFEFEVERAVAGTCSSRQRKRERSPEGLPTPASENNLSANDNNDVHLSLNNTSVFIFFSSVFEWRRNFGKI